MNDSARAIGLDLAWGGRNSSGLAVLEYRADHAVLIAAHDRVGDDDEILGLIGHYAVETTLVAIDAPLLVPNVHGRRPVETVLSRLLHKHQAAPHPANRRLFPDGVRGERIAHRLGALGFGLDPYLAPRSRARAVLEVYPHAAMITLFGLDKTLKYKARSDRELDERRAELRRYRSLLLSLERERPPLRRTPLWEDVLDERSVELTGGALKRREDLWDAVFCAYLGLYHWYWGAERCAVVGDTESGYIVLPTDPTWNARLIALGAPPWRAAGAENAPASPDQPAATVAPAHRTLKALRAIGKRASPLFAERPVAVVKRDRPARRGKRSAGKKKAAPRAAKKKKAGRSARPQRPTT